MTAELTRRWRFPRVRPQALGDPADPMAAKPFSLLAAVLRMAEVLSDALEPAEPELIAHLHLDMDWPEQRLTRI